MKTCRPVIADFQHFDEEQDPDSDLRENSDQDPHFSEKMDKDPYLSNANPQLCRGLWFNLFKILTRPESTGTLYCKTLTRVKPRSRPK
jgi:hypothetical protein